MTGNRWLLRERLVEDRRYERRERINEALAKDPEHLVDLVWKLISRALTDLEEIARIRFYSDVNKIIVYLPKADFTTQMLIKLARIIEGEDLQDLIVPRLRDR